MRYPTALTLLEIGNITRMSISNLAISYMGLQLPSEPGASIYILETIVDTELDILLIQIFSRSA
jgi:hypothetical protein